MKKRKELTQYDEMSEKKAVGLRNETKQSKKKKIKMMKQ